MWRQRREIDSEFETEEEKEETNNEKIEKNEKEEKKLQVKNNKENYTEELEQPEKEKTDFTTKGISFFTKQIFVTSHDWCQVFIIDLKDYVSLKALQGWTDELGESISNKVRHLSDILRLTSRCRTQMSR